MQDARHRGLQHDRITEARRRADGRVFTVDNAMRNDGNVVRGEQGEACGFVERTGGAELFGLPTALRGERRRDRRQRIGGRARKSRCASAPRTATSPLQVPSSTGTPASVKRSAIASWRSWV